MNPSRSPHGFSFFQAACLLVILVVLIGVLLPYLGHARRTARSMANSTQTRGIQQGFVTYAQSNRQADQLGYFPGLNSIGEVIPDGPATGFSGDGTHPAARMWMMLEAQAFTPEYMISPADTLAVEVGSDPDTGTYLPVKPENYSYAMLSLVGSENERAEWSDTLNGNAYVISARARGTGPDDISSVWTDLGSGEWHGEAVRNDNSTKYETTHVMRDTQYGDGEINRRDDLFAHDHATDDAFLVHEDATTAYSAE